MNKFQDIQKEIKKHHDALTRMLNKASLQASKSKDTTLIQLLEKEKIKVCDTLNSLLEKSNALYPDFQKELKKRTTRLESKIEKLDKAKDSLISDNFLLEYKKKDLLMLTNKLEDAYDEISLKNEELMLQQKRIHEQADKLSAIHQEILEKNEALELQKESLLDQSDYLHEANETISYMHRDLEQQKNETLQKNQELLNLNIEKNNLISIVAHDLKSPLNQIMGLLSIVKLTTENLSAETLSYINMMESSSVRLSDMIAKILDVEAIESQNLNVIIEPVNLSEVINQVAARYEISAGQKEIKIKKIIPANLFALVDRGYVDQVIENLISNAIKFSPRKRNVYLMLSAKNNSVICEVKDEGPGLTTADKEKLFGKYQKLSAKPTGDETSTGLGLSIVKKFVEAMQGKIWCESHEGKGASFFVEFSESIKQF